MNNENKLTVVKYSSQDCGLCGKMKFYDEKVARELGNDFIEIKIREIGNHPEYFAIMNALYPNDSIMPMPLYIVADTSETKPKVLGQVVGGHEKGEFRTLLRLAMTKEAVEVS